MEQRPRRGPHVAALVVGALLVLGGIALLIAQVYGIELRFDLARFGWPMFVILPGLALLVIGLLAPDEPGIGLAIAGGIVTTVGILLAYQQATNHWASWAYAWALVAPGSVGAAMLMWGVLHLRGSIIRGGLSALAVGLMLFLVFFGFFEGLLNIGGDRGLAGLGRTALPIALIAGGVLIIVARLWPRRRPDVEQTTYIGARPMSPPPAEPAAQAEPNEAYVATAPEEETSSRQ